MRVASCQLPDVRDDIGRATELIREFGARAEQRGADLVCFPECFLQGYVTDAHLVSRLAIDLASPGFDDWLEETRTLEPTLVIGVIERSGTDFFNTAIVVRSGVLVCRYRKTHLLNGELGAFRAGEGSCVFEIKGHRVGLAICNDLNFARAIGDNAAAGAKLVACPCNNMLRAEIAEKLKDEHNAIRRERAKESGTWLLTSDVTGRREGRVSYGPTALIRPDGVVAAQVPSMQAGMIVQDIE